MTIVCGSAEVEVEGGPGATKMFACELLWSVAFDSWLCSSLTVRGAITGDASGKL